MKGVGGEPGRVAHRRAEPAERSVDLGGADPRRVDRSRDSASSEAAAQAAEVAAQPSASKLTGRDPAGLEAERDPGQIAAGRALRRRH